MGNVKIGIREILASSGSGRIKLLKFFDLAVGSLAARLAKEKEGRKFPPRETIKNILLIRPGGIGDAIFLLPFLRALKQSDRTLRLDILCEKRNADIFETQRDACDQIYYYDKSRSFLSLRENTYDVTIDTEQWHFLSTLVSHFINGGYSIGFDTRPLRARLFDQKVPYDNDAYEMVNFARLFDALLKNAHDIRDINSCFRVSDQCVSWANQKIPGKSICIFLGASIPERRFTTEQSLAIIRFVIEKNFYAVVLGGTDVLAEQRIIEKSISNPQLLNFVGQTTLEQSAALIKESTVFVGPDSGLMHLACAVGTPVIAVFGPGNLKKWAPRGEKHSIMTENVSCSPCTYFGYTLVTCQGTFPCMRNIDLNHIFDAINKARTSA